MLLRVNHFPLFYREGVLVVHYVSYRPAVTYTGYSIPFYSRLYGEFREYGLFLIGCYALLLAASTFGWASRGSGFGRFGGAFAIGVLMLEILWQTVAPRVIVSPPMH